MASNTGDTKTDTQQTPTTPSPEPSEVQRYFSSKEDIRRITEEIKSDIIKSDEGEIKGIWILTEIDHWNHNHEKVIALTDKCMYLVKYDFITRRVRDFKVVPLYTLLKIQEGSLVYPAKSLMTSPNTYGMRAIWGDLEQVSFAQRWNPMCRTIPYVTLTHHPLFLQAPIPGSPPAAPEEGRPRAQSLVDIETYDAGRFAEILKGLVEGSSTQNIAEDIMIESYGNLTSVVFNQSKLGFSKDRNGISF